MTKFLLLLTALLPSIAFATDEVVTDILDLTNHWVGYTALALFATAYILVMVEEAIFTNIVHILPAALPRVTLAVQVCVGDIFSVCVC